MIDKKINGTSLDLHDNDWIGVVINNEDPTFSGRAKVRVFGVYQGLKDEHIPWASPVNSLYYGANGGASMSVPKIGQFVKVQFNNGDLYAPEILSIQNLDTDLINKIKNDYPGTHVLLYDIDADLSVIYQPNSGLMIFLKESFFQITPDSMITIQTEDAESLIQLEGDVTRIVTKNEIKIAAASKVEVSADEVWIKGAQTTKIGAGPVFHDALLAAPMWGLLSTMAGVIDAKLSITAGTMTALVEATKQAATSTNVKISK